MVSEVYSLSHEEAAESGFETFMNTDSFDNLGVDAMLNSQSSLPQQDNLGRPIISYKQYQEMVRRDMRLDNYVMRMVGPQGRGLIQASKYLKYYGQGFRPVEEVMAARKRVQAERDREGDRPQPTDLGDVQIYRCADRFPDCNRFFDSRRALETHWGMPAPSGHNEKKIKKD